MLRIFVYGTLKPGERNYPVYLDKRVIESLRAYTPGILYHLSLGYPAMTTGQDIVKGYLLTLADETILDKLDQLENYSPWRSPQENSYLRQRLQVYAPNGQDLGKAWSYVMSSTNVEKWQGKLIESGWWTQTTEHQVESQPWDD
ncbi:gamma-glutamylcyclotransferase family protein [Aphanothece sacrum]|uniref:Branched-chain alpha-keto acid dehydrogenase n=1 Tax=Aphanothece sacrum FPU1 TaxID=1920663 RepID=A0A401IJH0_APHSA|nr:gamma-glutamylcyclotransferase [Aphanothece sacrum]GBF81438.1 branched-chain alpha-keto acid dehydrogenase [Aphanothece sacrum FPU1]GBF85569.1 branched-chain alpha-keto acid dehydrogenase [Aphanothece sacrum FPU3]